MPKKHKVPGRKRCPRCKRTKPTKAGFYPDKQNKTGYRTYCKDCLKKPKAKGGSKRKPSNAAHRPGKPSPQRKASNKPAAAAV